MLRKISDFLFPLADLDEKVRVRRALYLILPLVAIASLTYGFFYSIENPDDGRRWLLFLAVGVTLISWGLAYKDYLRFSALFFAIGLWAIMTIGIFYSGGTVSIGHGGFLLLIFIPIEKYFNIIIRIIYRYFYKKPRFWGLYRHCLFFLTKDLLIYGKFFQHSVLFWQKLPKIPCHWL